MWMTTAMPEMPHVRVQVRGTVMRTGRNSRPGHARLQGPFPQGRGCTRGNFGAPAGAGVRPGHCEALQGWRRPGGTGVNGYGPREEHRRGGAGPTFRAAWTSSRSCAAWGCLSRYRSNKWFCRALLMIWGRKAGGGVTLGAAPLPTQRAGGQEQILPSAPARPAVWGRAFAHVTSLVLRRQARAPSFLCRATHERWATAGPMRHS